MKVNAVIILSGLATLAAANPQDALPVLRPEEICVRDKCQANDTACIATCMGVPNPSEQQVGDTTECVARCDQGDGTAEATEEYARCSEGCISSFFFASGALSPKTDAAPVASSVSSAVSSAVSAATSDLSSVVASATEAVSSVMSSAKSAVSSATASESATETSESATETSESAEDADSAASAVQLGAASFGLAGLVMAVFAL